MSITHNTIIRTEERSASGDADEPGSSSDADGPPEPEAPGIDAHAGDGTSRLQVIAPDSDSEDRSASPIDHEWIRAKLVDALECIDSAIARITVRLVDDAEMTELHRRHREIDETTDVLTFIASDEGACLEADIAVCVDVAARRAAELNHRTERELVLYALHGILHGVGYDDHDEDDYRRMHAEEDRVLESIGIGPVFGSRGDDAP